MFYLVDLIFPLFFSYNLLSTHSLVYIALSQLRKLSKTNLSRFCLWVWSFGSVIKTMMTAMIKPPHSNSDSDEYDTPSPLHSESIVNPKIKNSKVNYYNLKIKSKLLSLAAKNPMQRSSPKKNPFLHLTFYYHSSATDNNSLPHPNYDSLNNPPNNLSPCHSQLPSMSSPPYLHNSPSLDDTNFDYSSYS